MHFVKTGSMIRLISEDDVVINDYLEPKTYILKHSDQIGYYLEITNDIANVGKVYGNQVKSATRILRTFEEKNHNMGVLLIGTKGSGKTHLTRMISEMSNMPTIVINTPFNDEPFLSFIKNITTSCVLVFDEFEKMYPCNHHINTNEQQKLLTLLDGVYSTRHLYIFTANKEHQIDDLFINRPGRIYYRFDYSGLESDFIREYCEDHNVDSSFAEEIVRIASLFTDFNFDMLKAIVEEMKRYGETPSECISILNINPTKDKTSYDIDVVEVSSGQSVQIYGKNRSLNALSESFTIEVAQNCEDEDSIYVSLSPSNIKSFDITTGTVVYNQVDGFVVTLKQKDVSPFNYKSLLI